MITQARLPNGYWQERDFADLLEARDYRDLFRVAERVLKRMPAPVSQVCGPISTGGSGSMDSNLRRFSQAIERLLQAGESIFDQLPFQDPMLKIISSKPVGKYDHTLLIDFYLPIFESNLVHKFYFLPDWQTSTGASWEHEQLKRLGREIIYL